MFSFIRTNGKTKPLFNYETVIKLMGSAKAGTCFTI